jgi:hypothetical protein
MEMPTFRSGNRGAVYPDYALPAKVRAFRDFLRETLAPAGAAKR